jgi:SAM-dependent methyltransferase
MKTGGLAGKKLLDVGCSTGEFLLAARSLGAEPMGLDLDHGALRFVHDHLGIPVIQGDAGQVDLPHAAFDVITCWDLVEHLIEPRAGILRLVKALRPGGRIAFWTPNADLIGKLGEEWMGFRVDLEHLQYFTAQTLGSLLDDQGVHAIHHEAIGFPTLARLENPQLGIVAAQGRLRERLHQYRWLVTVADKLRAVKRGLPMSTVQGLECNHRGYHLFLIGSHSRSEQQ